MPFILIPVSPSTFSTTDCPCGKSCAEESLYCGRECAIKDTSKCLSSAECYYRTSMLSELIRNSSFDCIQDADFSPLSADYSAVSYRPQSDDFADWNDIETRESQAFSWSSLFRRTSASLRNRRPTSESSEAPAQSSDRPRDTAATSITPSNPIRILMHTKAYANVKRATTLFTRERVPRCGSVPQSESESVSRSSPVSQPLPTLRHVRRSVSVPRLAGDDDILDICNSICKESVTIAKDFHQRYKYV
jgi:hypothetical protein